MVAIWVRPMEDLVEVRVADGGEGITPGDLTVMNLADIHHSE
jgi:hypothetical protein